MSGNLILITGLIYTYVFVDQLFLKGNTGMGLAYLGYAFSNIGLFMAVTK
jgi:hypothetical protein